MNRLDVLYYMAKKASDECKPIDDVYDELFRETKIVKKQMLDYIGGKNDFSLELMMEHYSNI